MWKSTGQLEGTGLKVRLARVSEMTKTYQMPLSVASGLGNKATPSTSIYLTRKNQLWSPDVREDRWRHPHGKVKGVITIVISYANFLSCLDNKALYSTAMPLWSSLHKSLFLLLCRLLRQQSVAESLRRAQTWVKVLALQLTGDRHLKIYTLLVSISSIEKLWIISPLHGFVASKWGNGKIHQVQIWHLIKKTVLSYV